MKPLILTVMFFILILAILADYIFLKRMKQLFAPRYHTIARWICYATHLYIAGYTIFLYCRPDMVVLPSTPTLITIALFLSKLLFLLLWLLIIVPLSFFRHKNPHTFYATSSLSIFLCFYLLTLGLTTRNQIEVKRVEITSPRLPLSFDGYKIVQISDIHCGTFQLSDTAFIARAIDTIHALRPDIVCFTGDIVNHESKEIKPFIPAFNRLYRRQHPVYAVLGNHDYADYSRRMNDAERNADTDSLRKHIKELQWKLLDNRTHIIRHRSFHQPGQLFRPEDHIALIGVGNIGEPPFSDYGDLKKALTSVEGEISDSTFSILLSHNPSHWRREVLGEEQTIDLMLSGHTHGMQSKIFGISPARWIYKEWGGLYSEGDKHLYVNTGLGMVGFPIRLGIKPEITLITLRCGNR